MATPEARLSLVGGEGPDLLLIHGFASDRLSWAATAHAFLATRRVWAVDLPGHPAIQRVPASSLQPDSDLGERLVTRAVGPLADQDITMALRAGEARARALIDRGLIRAAALHLAGVTALVSTANSLLQPKAA